MRWLRRLRYWLQHPARAAELRDELALHRDMIERDLRGRGLTPAAARAAARRVMGNETYVREEVRSIWSWRWLAALSQDLRYGVRSLRRAPVFTFVAVLTLALGVGANSAMFAVVDALLFRPPPGVKDPARLARLQVQLPTRGSEPAQLSHLISYPDFADLRDHARGFDGVAAFVRATRPVGEGAAARSELTILASGSYFSVLGAQAALGRLLQPSDDRDSPAAALVVLSWDYWQRNYGQDPAVLGQTLRVAGRPFTIIGVAAKHFVGSELAAPALWISLGNAWQLGFDAGLTTMRFGVWLSVVGRLAATVTPEQAVAGAKTALHAGRSGSAATGKVDVADGPLVALTSVAGVSGETLEPGVTSQRAVPVSLRFLAITAVVLLIACANVANLLLARASQRGHELAVRASIGATQGRLVRQLLSESVLLAALGGIAGLALAVAGTALLPRVVPLPPLPPLLDARLLAFTIALTVVTIIVFGTAPALRAARADLRSALYSSRLHGDARSLVRRGLVVLQLAASVALLVSASLFLRSLRNVQAIDPGFAVDRLLVISGATRAADLTSQQADAFWTLAAERVRKLSGVQAAALGAALPFEEVYATPVSDPSGGTGPLPAQPDFADSAYFSTLGIPLLEGRAFTGADQHTEAAPVVIVNRVLARQLFGGASAIGRCIRAGRMPPNADCANIVGVAADANYSDVTRDVGPMYYRPIATRDPRDGWGTVLHVRTTAPPATLAAAIQRELIAIDPALLYIRVRPLTDLLAPQLVPWRTGAFVFALFGVVGIVLAAIGLYGVIALLVAQRAHEMGVRIALGARQGEVVRLVLAQGARLVAGGLVVGSLAAAAASRLFASMMYGLSAFDPIAYLGTSVVLAAVGMLALLLPAWRATRVDPLATLRVT